MHKRKFFNMIILIVGMVVLFSCEYEKIQYEAPPDPTIPISYSAEIQPIWDAKCVGCHSPGKTSPNLEAPSSYDNLFAGGLIDTLSPDVSIIYTCMKPGGSMAPFTNVQDANLVLVWIQQGAKNN